MNRIFGKPNAKAHIKGGSNTKQLSGEVCFYRKRDCILVVADISGLPNTSSGFYGFHIHEGNNCFGNKFENTGNHYNPNRLPHPLHAGDMPPLISCNGNAFSAFFTDRFGLNEIIGKTVVIHSNPDDFTTQPSGNAGTKIACGVIKAL